MTRPLTQIVALHEQVYLASELAVRGGSEVDRQYLAYLASRLGLSDARRGELDSILNRRARCPPRRPVDCAGAVP